MKVSSCCGKHGFVEVFDGRLSGTNYVDSEDMGLCPVCKSSCEYVEASVLNGVDAVQERDARNDDKNLKVGSKNV